MELPIEKTQKMTIELPVEIDKSYIQEALAAILYYMGKLKAEDASLRIGKTKREFKEKIIPKFGLLRGDDVKADI